ncbi:hypothetical protein EKD04_014395 [Chloroflexales bacterium ZM16-3]|nr:hypothetical protein [Chloroflexales bacterium ZM16-3]
MGETGELVSGMVAGGRSQRSGVRALAAIAATDSRRTDTQGRTFADRATERRVERTITRRPTVIDEVGALSSAARAVGTGALTTAVRDRGRQLGGAFQDRAGRVSDGWQRFRDDVADAHGGSANPIVQAAAGVTTLDRRLSRRGQAMRLNPETRQVVWSPRVAPADLPADALREPQPRVRVPRLLALGYHVQANDDGTVSAWQPTPAPAPANARRPSKPATPPDAANPQIAALNRRIALVEAGGLIGDLAALRAERAQLEAVAATQSKEATP